MASRAPRQQKKQPEGSGSKPALKKPLFVKIEGLKPGTSGHNLTVKVLSAAVVVPQRHPAAALGRAAAGPGRIAECLIGDDTGTVLFTARNDQVDLMKPGSTVVIRNAKIDMFKGSMRLAVDKWGRVEMIADPANFVVKEDNNLSLIEYELVNVGEE